MRWTMLRHSTPAEAPSADDNADHHMDDGASDQRDDAEAEARLVAAAQADAAAFDAIYHRYAARIYRYLRAHSRGDDDAADLTQHVFLRALDALPRYRPSAAPFAAWLFRIARNALVDAGRHRRDEAPWEALPDPTVADDDDNPEAQMLHRETRERLRTAIAALDAEKRELLALRFAGRLSAPEIAAVVGKRPEAVKKQLTRILHALREQLDDSQ